MTNGEIAEKLERYAQHGEVWARRDLMVLAAKRLRELEMTVRFLNEAHDALRDRLLEERKSRCLSSELTRDLPER